MFWCLANRTLLLHSYHTYSSARMGSWNSTYRSPASTEPCCYCLLQGEEELLHGSDETVVATLTERYRLGAQAVTRLFRELRDITQRLATQQVCCCGTRHVCIILWFVSGVCIV